MNNPYEMKLEMLAKNDSACEWARDEINKLRAELDEHKAARRAYASEFAPNADGEPDVGSIHQNIRGAQGEVQEHEGSHEEHRVLLTGNARDSE